MDLSEILNKEGILDYDKPIQRMPTEELLEEFSFKTTGNPNAIKAIRNIIWQAYTWIQDGKREPVDGNLRSFWYTDIKAPLSRMGLDTTGRKYTERVYDAFVEMVTVYGLFSYRDFGFIDENAHTRMIGKGHGDLIVFCEKNGLFPVLQEIYREYDVTVISLGGYPSYISTENLVWELREVGIVQEGKKFLIFSIVDYDPSGYWIEREFCEQLETFGISVGAVHSLITTNRLDPERVEYSKYKLKDSAKTRNWLEKTGGINGEAYGIEANAFKKREIVGAFEEEAGEFI